jgi:hypothetical protein
MRKRNKMGTRNLTVVKNLEGTTKIAQYGQWDGYPEHSGIVALEFLRDKVNRDNLLVELQNVEFIDDQEAEAIYEEFDHDYNDPTKYDLEYPGLTRNTGIDILKIVANTMKPVKTIDNSEFAKDTLFCEGIYEVDFSTNKFISIYNDNTVSYDLDELPSNEEYLAMWVSSDSLVV